jgi:Domain of unknown function (DUF4301)
MSRSDLSTADLRQLAERGIPGDEAERQLELLRHPPAPAGIARPCTVGAGILRLEPGEHEALLAGWRGAVDAGRLSKFVPASGAATRMFADLHPMEPGSEPSNAARELAARRAELACATHLEAALAGARLDPVTVARALVGSPGLGYGELPKALIPFHRYAAGPRTAFLEHLVEGATYVAPPGGACRVHFTVGAGLEPAFSDHLEAARAGLEAALDVRLEVSFSVQDPATDTLCLDADGTPCRDRHGRLLLRPSGHGALLHNLERAGGDLVVIKNVDNILPADRQAEAVHWKRLVIGLLVRLEATLEEIARDLDAGGAAAPAARRLADALGLEPPPRDAEAWVRDRLRRPLRVCGMVRHSGDPGGGPFWLEPDDGTRSPQIVETAQIDRDDPRQSAAWASATHFNPVDLACTLRDRQGRPRRLGAFVDPSTAFVSRKEHNARTLWALERPGLWNGSMAGWNTVFVEVPASTFAPVKTVLDLLRPEHQAFPASGP